MDALTEKYNETLKKYQYLVMQRSLNRGGDDMMIKLLKLELERLAHKIKTQSGSTKQTTTDQTLRTSEQPLQ